MSRFVVIVRGATRSRAFGVYRSFKSAWSDANAWEGYVLSLESADAEEPWNPSYEQAVAQ